MLCTSWNISSVLSIFPFQFGFNQISIINFQQIMKHSIENTFTLIACLVAENLSLWLSTQYGSTELFCQVNMSEVRNSLSQLKHFESHIVYLYFIRMIFCFRKFELLPSKNFDEVQSLSFKAVFYIWFFFVFYSFVLFSSSSSEFMPVPLFCLVFCVYSTHKAAKSQ